LVQKILFILLILSIIDWRALGEWGERRKARFAIVALPNGRASDLPAAHCRHDADFAFVTDGSLQSLIAPRDLSVHENVHVGPHFAPFCQHSISQTDVTVPKYLQSFAHVAGPAFNLDFGLPTGKLGQVT
jgi:hypothetical protein